MLLLLRWCEPGGPCVVMCHQFALCVGITPRNGQCPAAAQEAEPRALSLGCAGREGCGQICNRWHPIGAAPCQEHTPSLLRLTSRPCPHAPASITPPSMTPFLKARVDNLRAPGGCHQNQKYGKLGQYWSVDIPHVKCAIVQSMCPSGGNERMNALRGLSQDSRLSPLQDIA